MRITLPRGLRRWWIALMNIGPVCDAISPEYHDAPLEQETALRRGLSEIQRASQDNVIYLAERRRQLDAIVSYRRTH